MVKTFIERCTQECMQQGTRRHDLAAMEEWVDPSPEAQLDEAIIIHKMWKLGVDNKIVLPGPKNGHNMRRTVHPNTKVYQ